LTKHADNPRPTSIVGHGSLELPNVVIDSYNEELRDGEGWLGDRASNRAFREILQKWRDRLSEAGGDPIGDLEKVKKRKLDELLVEGDAEAAGLVQSVIEEFSQELAHVIRRFLKLKTWRDTERIVIGGGLRESRVGELAIGRVSAMLKVEKYDIELKPIENHPDEAGLIGAVQLAPSWVLKGHDSILAVDIGGSNIRAGIVTLNLDRATDLSKAAVSEVDLWPHAEEKPTREEAIDRLVGMLKRLVKHAEKEKLELAPFVGIGCPGIINADGTIDRGAQNLPGKWDGKGFNLAERLSEKIPQIGEHASAFVLHNDAVVQGLSEVPEMADVKHWGVLTIGTGLGNARFSNKQKPKKKKG
jgi:predicted NBD/HSP70 family sugar kinase